MPTGLTRFQESGHVHAITFICDRREPLLERAGGYEVFEQSLERTRERRGLLVFGYVLMAEHVHLLVS